MTLRPATERDVEAIVAMGTALAEEGYHELFRVDAETAKATVTSLLTSIDSIGLILEVDEVPVGSLLAHVYTHPLTGLRTASEIAWWMYPDARGHGMKLLHAFKQWAIERGAEVMELSGPAGEQRLEQLYGRLEFAPIATTYQRRIA